MVNRESHGGNIYRLAEKLGMEESEIIDFSASINPLGVPKSVISEIRDSARHLCHYPDPDAKQLRLWLAKHLSINSQSILCGNGSTELIYLVVRALRPEKVLIPVPTFSEYEKAVTNPKRIIHFPLFAEDGFSLDPDEFIAAMSGSPSRGAGSRDDAAAGNRHSSPPFDMAFLCNPNNPTGAMLGKEEVLKIAGAAKRLRCYLVVDEAFIDFAPKNSVVREVEKNPYLIVLRSLTKFYALSGLRIGFGVIPLPVIDIMKETREPWTVNTLAQAAGIAALNDSAYKEETFRIIQKEKKVLEDGFRLLGIEHLPSGVNFYLIRLGNAQEIFLALRNKGIMVRDCSNFPGLDGTYLRIAVKSNKDNMHLLQELANLCMAS